MKSIPFLLLIFLLSSCYFAPDLPGFEKTAWERALEDCTNYRIVKSKELLIGSESHILTLNQNELKELLGLPDQHQLFNRNQKFFYYQLDCEVTLRLAVRFDALGRVKEVTIEKTQ